MAGLDGNPRDTAVVSAVIALGAELGVTVVAEGVETSHQLAALRRLGCPAVRGFLLDRPGPEPRWAPSTVLGSDSGSVGSLPEETVPDPDQA